jgi:hypothetical protein
LGSFLNDKILIKQKHEKKKTQINKNNLNNSNLKNSNLFTFLPVELNSILIGIMLGDGGMYRS